MYAVLDKARQPNRIASPEYLRHLPDAPDEAKTVVPGVGVFIRKDIDGTHGVSGFNIYFQPEGALGAVPATIRFKLVLKDDFSPAWTSRFLGGSDLSSGHRSAMEQHGRAIAEVLWQRSPGDYARHLIEAIGAEVRSMSATQRDLRDRTERYRRWLIEPILPRRKPYSCGLIVPPTNEEAAERRKLWRRELGRAESQLSQFEASFGHRLIRLRHMHSRLNDEHSRRNQPPGLANVIGTAFQERARHRGAAPCQGPRP